MGMAYVAGNLVKSGDFRLLERQDHTGTTRQQMNQHRCCVSQIAQSISLKENGETRYFHLTRDSAETWFGIGFAFAEGTPFVAAVNEEYLPRLLSMASSLGLSFSKQEPLLQSDSREAWACLASEETIDRELEITILKTLESKDRFQGFGSLKSQLRGSLTGLNALAPALDSLLKQGYIQEHYDLLGNEEISETYAITQEGLTWLRTLQEAEGTPPIGTLCFAD